MNLLQRVSRHFKPFTGMTMGFRLRPRETETVLAELRRLEEEKAPALEAEVARTKRETEREVRRRILVDELRWVELVSRKPWLGPAQLLLPYVAMAATLFLIAWYFLAR